MVAAVVYQAPFGIVDDDNNDDDDGGGGSHGDYDDDDDRDGDSACWQERDQKPLSILLNAVILRTSVIGSDEGWLKPDKISSAKSQKLVSKIAFVVLLFYPFCY